MRQRALICFFSMLLCLPYVDAADPRRWEFSQPSDTTDAELFPSGVHDPIEPINRLSFGLNRALFNYILHPTSRGYRWLVPEAGRERISNFHKNLLYPIRLVNNGLQWQWNEALKETKRFGINTTVGFLGFNDPASTKYELASSDEDLGQTFGVWGWRSQVYLFLPVLGPSSERDALGMFGDSFLDPAAYYWPGKAFLSFNDIAGYTDQIHELLMQNYDPYELTRLLYSVAREAEVTNYVHSERSADGREVQTLRAVFAKPEDRTFQDESIDTTVDVPGWRKPLPYSIWLQEEDAPLVVQIPGLGSHRKGNMDLALAELAYEEGYSVLIFSSTFNWEFMESAPLGFAPGYVEQDKRFLREAYHAIMADLRSEYGEERFTTFSLMGMSMGAWYTLNLAADLEEQALNQVDHCIAINPPVDLMQGLLALDTLYRAPTASGGIEQAQAVIDSAIAKALLSVGGGDLKPTSTLPFTDEEAAYLIGLNFRLTLQQTLLSSGVFDDEIGIMGTRGGLYGDLVGFSFEEYFHMLSTAMLEEGAVSREAIQASLNLRNRADDLKEVSGLHLILTENDFLLSPSDLDWLKSTFEGKTTIFPHGGHLGEIWLPELRRKVRSQLRLNH